MQAYITNHSLRAQLAKLPPRLPSGLVGYAGSGGPEIVLPGFGYDALARMLEATDHATLAMAGAGIGHINGQTGNVYESGGPQTQQMATCHLSLKQAENALSLEIEGTLHPPSGSFDYQPLGPRFEATMLLPHNLLAIRGVELPGAFERRSAILDEAHLSRTLPR